MSQESRQVPRPRGLLYAEMEPRFSKRRYMCTKEYRKKEPLYCNLKHIEEIKLNKHIDFMQSRWSQITNPGILREDLESFHLFATCCRIQNVYKQ
jgi:hypothetical protein